MRILGKVLWFDTRDGEGIVRDAVGNEYYIDSSVFPRSEYARSGLKVSFELNTDIKHVRCGRAVELDLEHAVELQLCTVEALFSHPKEELREGAREEAFNTLAKLVALRAAA